MSITDELRKYADRLSDEAARKSEHGFSPVAMELERIADRIDAEHEAKVSYWQSASYKDGYDEGFASADDWLGQHEDAMAEHGWVKLPVDADGECIHIGDSVMDVSDKWRNIFDVCGFILNSCGWTVEGDSIDAAPEELVHHHEPTVEDVLRDVVTLCHNTWKEESPFHFYDVDDVMKSGNIAEFASRLRLAEEGA